MNAYDFTEEECLAAFKKSMKELSFEEKQAKKRNNIRKGKADFCNLKAQETIFMAE